MNIYYTAALSFIISFSGAFFVSRFGVKLGFSDIPSERSSHKVIVPKGGGIGILLSFFFVSTLHNIELQFTGPAVFVSLLSFYGDKIDLSPLFRLTLHIICGYIIVYNLTYHIDPYLNAVIIGCATVFIAGTANFYNFMDGIDGIASITAIIAFTSLYFYIGKYIPDNSAQVLCLSIVAASAGFLPLNFPKAKVFMGDVGSLLLGFIFGAFVILLSKSILDFLCLAGFLFPFYADELLTMFIRFKNRESLGKAHRKHLYQMLVNELGCKHSSISILYAVFQIILSITLFFLRKEGILMILITLGSAFILFSVFYFNTRRKVVNG